MESKKILTKIVPLPDCLHDRNMWDSVRDGYQHNTMTQDLNISKEIEILRDGMETFDQGKGSRYIISEFLGVGGVGIVFKVWDKVLFTTRALKIARPIIGKEDLIAGILNEEISRLQELSHPNLISIFDVGEINSKAGILNFYTMTYLKGAISGRKYFSQPRTCKQLLIFLSGFFSAVEYLHSTELVHLDLKPSNVFVGEDGYALIGDLGGARSMAGNLDDDLTITCTSAYAHPSLLGLTSVSSEDNRRRGKVKRRDIKYEFDRYSLGKSLFEIIYLFDIQSPSELSQYYRKYLQLQAARLLDGETSPNERPLGLTEITLQKLSYNSTQKACTDFDKMIGRVNLLNEIPEISSSNNTVIQVTRGRKTRLTPRLNRLLEEPLMRRLGAISQLGLVRFVYPGATHTRLEHSLGVFSNAVEYIRALYNDPINPLFRQIMSHEDLVALLLAALLHDLGQYQHAHDLYEVEPTVFSHESLTKSLLKADWTNYRQLTYALRSHIEKQWGIKPDRIVEILEANPDNFNLDIKNRILHTIISGPLDVDKLDYLLRDSDNCQAVFGNGLDRTRLLSTLTVVYQRDKGDQQYFALGIHEKGRAAAESLGFIRFQMFRSVYWHHTVRSAKTMLQRAAFEWIAKGGYEKRKNDNLKRELHDFILEYGKYDKILDEKQSKIGSLIEGIDGKESMNDSSIEPVLSQVGFPVKPQWSYINHSDLKALIWLHKRTSETGRRLIENLAMRELYKRVFVISYVQEPTLWKQIQKKISSYNMLKESSEKLRKALKNRVDTIIEKLENGNRKFYVSGVGDDTSNVLAASQILGMEGTVLIDMPFPRSSDEKFLFSPEDLHRGQKEEFQSPSFLVVSDLWKIFSENLHEVAGNVRIFVHPRIDVLRNAKTTSSIRILDSSTIGEELKNIFLTS